MHCMLPVNSLLMNILCGRINNPLDFSFNCVVVLFQTLQRA